MPTGPRGAFINEKRVKEVQPLIEAMRAIGQEHGDKTPVQVAINWTICKGVHVFCSLPRDGAVLLQAHFLFPE